MASPIRIDVPDATPGLPQQLMGLDRPPTIGETATIEPGARVRFLRGNERGIDEGAIASFLLDQYASVATGLLAAYLYDKLKSHGKTVRIAGESVPLNEKDIQKKLDELIGEEAQHDDG